MAHRPWFTAPWMRLLNMACGLSKCSLMFLAMRRGQSNSCFWISVWQSGRGAPQSLSSRAEASFVTKTCFVTASPCLQIDRADWGNGPAALGCCRCVFLKDFDSFVSALACRQLAVGVPLGAINTGLVMSRSRFFRRIVERDSLQSEPEQHLQGCSYA